MKADLADTGRGRSGHNFSLVIISDDHGVARVIEPNAKRALSPLLYVSVAQGRRMELEGANYRPFLIGIVYEMGEHKVCMLNGSRQRSHCALRCTGVNL